MTFRKLIDEPLKKYEPVIMSGAGVAAAVITTSKMKARMMAILYAQGLMTKAVYEKYVRNTRSNNWLKMHGYPLRRKAR